MRVSKEKVSAICCNHNPMLSPFINYHRVCNKSNTTGSTSGVGSVYHSGAHEFIPSFTGVRVAQSLVCCGVFCRSLFVLLSFFLWPLYCLSFDLQLLWCHEFVPSRLSFWFSLTFSYVINDIVYNWKITANSIFFRITQILPSIQLLDTITFCSIWNYIL
jgi:hypothetical protein